MTWKVEKSQAAEQPGPIECLCDRSGQVHGTSEYGMEMLGDCVISSVLSSCNKNLK